MKQIWKIDVQNVYEHLSKTGRKYIKVDGVGTEADGHTSPVTYLLPLYAHAPRKDETITVSADVMVRGKKVTVLKNVTENTVFEPVVGDAVMEETMECIRTKSGTSKNGSAFTTILFYDASKNIYYYANMFGTPHIVDGRKYVVSGIIDTFGDGKYCLKRIRIKGVNE